MLRLAVTRGTERLVWDDDDTMAMARVLGATDAIKKRAPYLDSIVKASWSAGVFLEPQLAARLSVAKALRAKAQRLLALPDVALNLPKAQKYFAHQRVDLHFMREMRQDAYLLASQPGVGKTLPAIIHALLRCEGEADPLDFRILVITPNSAKRQWRRAIRRWCTGGAQTVRIVKGTIAEQTRIAQQSGWIIGHWESLVHAASGYLAQPWDVVILDEAHNGKNRDAQRTETIFQLEAFTRLALTAHPFSNTPDELFAILKFLYPERYQSFWRYFGMHVLAQPKPFGGFEVLGTRNPKLLRWELAPFTIRRLKRDVFADLPPIQRIRRDVTLTTRGRREYEALKHEFFVELEAHRGQTKILVIPSVLARVTRLRQYLVDPGLVGGREKSVKYPEVLAIMDELDGPPVIFTQFKQAALRLGHFLTQHHKHVGYIYGGMGDVGARRHAKRFLAGHYDALIVVYAAGKEALNLGKYGYVIQLDLPWNPKDVEQSEGRVDRPEEDTGRLVATTAYRIIVDDSYERRLEKRNNRKHNMFKEVFTVSDLKELFA